ncbi:pentatricopeptide repeat-containing protein [Tanacetum coccineum]
MHAQHLVLLFEEFDVELFVYGPSRDGLVRVDDGDGWERVDQINFNMAVLIFLERAQAYETLDLLNMKTNKRIGKVKCKGIAQGLRRYWLEKDDIIWNTMVDMYAKLGDVDSARKLFDVLSLEDVVSCDL